MKKHTERQPIDDLFARKLGDMSLPPSPTGFERLQARLGHTKAEPKMVFWRNPDSYRYMAAAACLLLVCLFGWLYWPSGNPVNTHNPQVASNKPVKNQSSPMQTDDSAVASEQVNDTPSQSSSIKSEATSTEDQLAQGKPVSTGRKGAEKAKSGSTINNTSVELTRTLVDEPVLAQTTAGKTDHKTSAEQSATNTTTSLQPAPSDQPVVAAAKPAPAAERVLVVTIAEPEALVAARQVAKTSIEEKSAVAVTDKSEKENKSANLWQQVKRFKQGEVFARGDKDDNESGLLGRAYSGIKHSFEKDKAAKQ